MTATNHAIFGALTVAVVTNPVLGIPLALASHFALDLLPHFGPYTLVEPGSKELRAIVTFDAFLTTAFVILVTFAGVRAGYAWWLLPTGALLAVLPDAMWFKHYKNDLKGEETEWGKLHTWHKKIQHWELSWGWTIEVVWYVITLALLSQVIFS